MAALSDSVLWAGSPALTAHSLTRLTATLSTAALTLTSSQQSSSYQIMDFIHSQVHRDFPISSHYALKVTLTLRWYP